MLASGSFIPRIDSPIRATPPGHPASSLTESYQMLRSTYSANLWSGPRFSLSVLIRPTVKLALRRESPTAAVAFPIAGKASLRSRKRANISEIMTAALGKSLRLTFEPTLKHQDSPELG